MKKNKEVKVIIEPSGQTVDFAEFIEMVLDFEDDNETNPEISDSKK